MLPRKNSSPFTEEVISVRSVFFLFFRKSGCSTVYAHGNIHQNAERKRVAVHVDLSVSDGSVQYFHKKSKSEGKDRHDDKVLLMRVLIFISVTADSFLKWIAVIFIEDYIPVVSKNTVSRVGSHEWIVSSCPLFIHCCDLPGCFLVL